MEVLPIQTEEIKPHHELSRLLDRYFPVLANRDIVAISSKIISVLQGRLVAKSLRSKKELIYQEADLVLEDSDNDQDFYLTIKDNRLIPSAGIDTSNVKDAYILYPENLFGTADWLWRYLVSKHQLKKLGLLITDSNVAPMRRGVTGIALAWAGFEPLYSYTGRKDLHGAPFKVTQTNNVDALAAAAVFVMGEGDERTPLAHIRGAPRIRFLNPETTTEEESDISISMDQDLFGPLLRAAKWTKPPR
jgi:putative folate metabolism gamma-glutamate ligase